MAEPFNLEEGMPTLQIYPNPSTNGTILISGNFDGDAGTLALVRVYSLVGGLTKEKRVLINEDNKINLEFGNLENGVYFVEVEIEGTEKQFAKLIINK